MCFSAGFQVPASHQLRSCMHGLFHDRLVFPCGTVKRKHAWRWAGGKRNYLSFIRSQKFGETDVWFQSWADAQVKSYFVQTTSPTLRRDIFRVKGQAKPREIPEHGLFCSWLDMEFISDKARLALLLQIQRELGLVHAHRSMHTHACAHTRTNQFSPVCWGGFSYSIWSQRFHLSHSDSERCSSACLLPPLALRQKNPPPCFPPFPAHTTQKAKTDSSLPLQLRLISQNTHMWVIHGNSAKCWINESTGGGVQGSGRSRARFFFYHCYYYYYCLLF